MAFAVLVGFIFAYVEFTAPVQANDNSKTTKTTAPNNKANDETEESAPATKSSSAGTQRDPFLVPSKIIRPPKVAKTVVKKPEPQPVAPPNIETRVTDYKKLVRDYLEGRGNEPSKTTPYLIDELAVTGIFRTEEGYGAFVVESATQKQQVFFVRTGWQAYDGQIKEILPTGVKFIKKTRLDNGSIRQTEEFRPLPVPTAK
ncbi:MAG: hypothetical protein JST84_17890 [Acidobacteria bacterium]|nr:hypothetical protein [Acidobacteriota bacterium]